MRRAGATQFFFGSALALTLISSAQAQVETPARLLTRPDAQTFTDVFPPIPLAHGVSGRAVVECRVDADGSSECNAVEEAPGDVGFGHAAAAMAQGWRFSPSMRNGRVEASTLRIPIEFQNPTTQPAVIESLVVDGVSGETPPPQTEIRDMAGSVCRWGANRECLALSAQPGRQRRDHNAAYYPAQALAQGISGRALIACAVRSDRRVDCEAEREAPEASEFGTRAAELVRDVARQHADQLQPGAAFRVAVDFAVHERGRGPADRSRWQFSELPSGELFARAYPSNAADRNTDGAVDMACEIKADRRFNCVVIEECPAGAGFGVAGLQVSAAFELSQAAFGQPGFAVGDRVRRVIRFQIN
jgi:TonB family protein